MAGPIEILHAKLRSAGVVEKSEVDDAKAEYATFDDAKKLANREMLLELRYRVNKAKVKDDAQADLLAFQDSLPTGNFGEQAKHRSLDAGEKIFNTGSEMLQKGGDGLSEIGEHLIKGEVGKALTHPIAATVLGVTGLTLLSRWVLNTQKDNEKTSWWWNIGKNLMWATGMVYAANVIQKYSK